MPIVFFAQKTKSEQDIEREFIQRLFPELKDEEINNPELFKTKGETFIRNYLSNLRQESSKSDDDQDAQQLKVQLQHYENVIDSTVSRICTLLNSLLYFYSF